MTGNSPSAALEANITLHTTEMQAVEHLSQPEGRKIAPGQLPAGASARHFSHVAVAVVGPAGFILAILCPSHSQP
jgi:hypothetical protein